MNSIPLFFLKIIILSLSFISLCHPIQSQDLQRIKHFGKNKGHLKMYVHAPVAIEKTKPSPMVVVLHGCLQCAGSVAAQSGWNKLADEYGFYVMYPQQRTRNNPMKCFKYFKRKHTNKNRGENYSILQMVNFMKNNYSIDSSKVFITGLSAGAAMSVIMMADYPETFNAGALFAGGAYKAGNGYITAMMGMLGWRVKSAQKWGEIVRKQNPNYSGNYPRIIIYQGNNDWIVNKRNGIELMKQWTNLHHIGTQPDETINNFLNNADIERNVYRSSDKKEAVIFYKVNKLSHALLVDPGKCKYEGGRRGFFSRDKNYFSTLWTAYDFGLIDTPVIEGKTTVASQEQNLTYTVPLNSGSRYEWTYPSDCTLIKNTNSGTITLNWGGSNGCIDVKETDSLSCKKQYKTLFVRVTTK